MDKQETKLAGAYVPQQVYDFITLYALIKNKSKSNIIREILLSWIEDSAFDIWDMETLIAQSTQTNWEKMKLSSLKDVENKIGLFHDYLAHTRKDLELKCIPEQSIVNILKDIEI